MRCKTLIATALLSIVLTTHVHAQNRQGQARPLPDSITVHRNLPYADTDNPRQQLDLLLPKEASSDSLPIIVFIHGGGWRNGSKNSGLRRVAPFVETGKYAAAAVGYRLTGESIWPTQINDCKAAIRWIRANATKYGISPDRIAVWGLSAGGHLVAMLGTSSGNESMDGSLGTHTNQSSQVTCVVNFYGPTNFLTMNKTAIPGARLDHDAPDSPESRLIGGPIQAHPERVAAANPITYVDPTDSPFLIVHGTQDPLVSLNQSELLHTALKNAKVPSTLIKIENGGHGKGFPKELNDLVTKFLAHHLLDQIIPWKDQTLPANDNPMRR